MKTAEEQLQQILNALGMSLTKDLKECIIEGYQEYAREAIKADRENVAKYAQAKENPSDYGTGEIWVDRNSIINAPNIELL